MAYKCTRTNYCDRLYIEGEVYDAIGEAGGEYFEDLDASGDGVVETGMPDERKEVRDALDKLGVDYNARFGLKKLKAILQEAQQKALTT